MDPTAPGGPELLQGVKEIGQALGLPSMHRQTLRYWVLHHGLPAVFLGDRWYARPEALRSWWSTKEARSLDTSNANHPVHTGGAPAGAVERDSELSDEKLGGGLL